MAITTPKNVSLGLKRGWEYQSMAKVMDGGLCSTQDMEEVRKVLLYPYDYFSVMSLWSHRVLSGQYLNKDTDIMSMLNVDVVSNWVNDTQLCKANVWTP